MKTIHLIGALLASVGSLTAQTFGEEKPVIPYSEFCMDPSLVMPFIEGNRIIYFPEGAKIEMKMAMKGDIVLEGCDHFSLQFLRPFYVQATPDEEGDPDFFFSKDLVDWKEADAFFSLEIADASTNIDFGFPSSNLELLLHLSP